LPIHAEVQSLTELEILTQKIKKGLGTWFMDKQKRLYAACLAVNFLFALKKKNSRDYI
jgi:hypothetical protein